MISPRGFVLLEQAEHQSQHNPTPPAQLFKVSVPVALSTWSFIAGATPSDDYDVSVAPTKIIAATTPATIPSPSLHKSPTTAPGSPLPSWMATTPLQIPRDPRCRRRGSHNVSSRSRKPRPRDVHSPDALPPAVAALLAITDIPPRRRSQSSSSQSSSPLSSCSSSVAIGAFQFQFQRRRKRNDSNASLATKLIHTMPMSPTEASLFSETESMPELAILGPLDVLLSPPLTDDEDGVFSGSEITPGVASWADAALPLSPSLSTDSMSSLGSCSPDLAGPAPIFRSKRFRPVRQELEMVSTSLDTANLEHPLNKATTRGAEPIDVAASPPDAEVRKLLDNHLGRTIRPFKSAFKSNLTASLRVIRSAARSISTLNFPALPPDDLLSRSILTMDPSVPYTDERRPPVLEETPPPALRRYLNPTSDARIADPRPGTKTPAAARTIPMQTYKIERSRSSTLVPPSAAMRMRDHLASSSPAPTTPAQALPPSPLPLALPLALRPREMRENPDFIRIAVMEMAMRRSGKLDGSRPGRARWALPPRACTNKPYPVREDGVPARWVPVAHGC